MGNCGGRWFVRVESWDWYEGVGDGSGGLMGAWGVGEGAGGLKQKRVPRPQRNGTILAQVQQVQDKYKTKA